MSTSSASAGGRSASAGVRGAPAAVRSAEVGFLIAVLSLAAALAWSGCARSGAAPPATPPAAPHASSVMRAAGNDPSGAAASSRPTPLDPSEEITAEELATIPEPVPGIPEGGGGASPRSPLRAAGGGYQGGSVGTGSDAGAPRSLWRVQIFATQDRSLADRMAGEAAALLLVTAHVAYEAPQYKVRLGDYRSEAEAGPLREEAQRAGFPGAFRIRCSSDTTHSAN